MSDAKETRRESGQFDLPIIEETPKTRARFRTPTPESIAAMNAEGERRYQASQAATHRQLRYLQAVGREAGYDAAALDNRSVQEFGVEAAKLSRRDCSTLIDIIQTEDRTWKEKAPMS